MMVPESEIGVDKKFSFAGDQLLPPKDKRPFGQGINQNRNQGFNRNQQRPFRPNCEF